MSTTDAIVLDRASPLLERLLELLPTTLALLDDGAAWNAFDVDGRHRLLARNRLLDRAHGRTYNLALHRFNVVGAKTALHDHRYACAVFPFGDVGTPERAPLYDMPWERRSPERDAGQLVVTDCAPWAIVEHTAVWHAVHSHGAHYSVLLSDVTDGPARADRLPSRRLSFWEARTTRRAMRRALAAALKRRASSPDGY